MSKDPIKILIVEHLLEAQNLLVKILESESSLVHGMPGEAIRIGAAQHVMPCYKIPAFLIERVCFRK